MATTEDYAALSAIVYNNARGDENELVTPANWTLLPLNPNNSITGFTAAAFQNTLTGEIVISYKGTDGDDPVQMAQDFLFGNAAAFGTSVQLYQAALFYQQVKALYGSNITFTGHSLGGGLASVMGVWFGKSATTFAQAPFEAAALNPITLAKVGALLAAAGYVDGDYLAVNPLSYFAREANITNYTVIGEVLSKYLFLLPNVVGSNNLISLGGTDPIASTTLHSILLHSASLMSQTFVNDTILLPQLLTEIFDTNLYAARTLRSNERDFLNHLLKDQIKIGYADADGLLARFAGDLDKLTNDALLKDGALGKALIDIAIADYYFMENGFTNDFFSIITGGVNFDLSDIGSNWSSNKTVAQLGNAIVTQFLNGDQQARPFLVKDNYWSIQSGTDALNANGSGNNNDAMIGGSGGNTLDGGAGNDFLYGGDDADTLTGGAGNDLLEGGAGSDTYYAAAGDKIFDSDGQGTVFIGAYQLIGGAMYGDERTYISADEKHTYAIVSGDINQADGATLIVDGVTIQHFKQGDLGINLGAAQIINQAIQTNTVINGDFEPAKDAQGNDLFDQWGNPVPGGAAPGRADTLYDTPDNDLINAGDGNDTDGGDDIIELGAGDDDFYTTFGAPGRVIARGGDGRDYLGAGSGKDIVEGGNDADGLYGSDENDQLFGDAQGTAQDFIDQGAIQQGNNLQGEWFDAEDGNDQVFGGAGNDFAAGGGGNDLIVTERIEAITDGDRQGQLIENINGADHKLVGEAANDASYGNPSKRSVA